MVAQQGTYEWAYVKIGDCLSFKNGLNKGKEYFGHGTPIINYMDVYANPAMTADDIEGTVEVTDSEISRFEAKKNDVFFTRTSETPEEVGYASVLLDDIDDCVFSGFVLRGRPTSSRLYPGYCAYCFMSWPVRSEIERSCTCTTRALTNGKVLSAIEIPLPPYEEQVRIAKALSDIDGLIENLEKLLEKKKNIKTGAMQELLTGKRRLPGFNGEWKQERLGELTCVFSGATPSSDVSRYWGGDIPWMASGELHQKRVFDVAGRITEEGYRSTSTRLVPERSVLLGLAGQGKTRGTAAYLMKSLCTNQSIAAVYPNDEIFDSEFLFHLLDSMYLELREMSSGDGGRGGLTKKHIESLELTLPPLVEQRAIAEVLSDMDIEISQLQGKLDKYKRLKAGMMDELLTGRIRLVD